MRKVKINLYDLETMQIVINSLNFGESLQYNAGIPFVLFQHYCNLIRIKFINRLPYYYTIGNNKKMTITLTILDCIVLKSALNMAIIEPGYNTGIEILLLDIGKYDYTRSSNRNKPFSL